MKISVADNLYFLREHYPDIYRLVRNRTKNTEKYVAQPSRNGQPNIGITQEDGQVRLLYSKYNPEVECMRWAESQASTVEGAEDILVLGIELGYHAYALLSAHPDKRMFLYEPDIELFIAALETVDIRPLLSNKQIGMLAIGDDDGVKGQLLLQIYKYKKGKLAIVATPHVARSDIGQLEKWEKLTPEMGRSYSSNVVTVQHHKTSWIENAMVNLVRNLKTPTFYHLKAAFQGVPVIVAGSGPSLELEAEKLRELQDRTLIIAAGTATSALLHLGIRPHLIVTMDPDEMNRKAFEKLDLRDCPLLYMTTVNHKVIKEEDSPYLMHGYLNSDVISKYMMELKKEHGVLSSTPTVTGTAIQVAAFLGCTEVTFIGQDFSYPQEKMYSSGVDHVSADFRIKRVSSANQETPNVNGGMNRTTSAMLNLKSGVESVLKALPAVSFFNASPVGALIENTEPRTLEQLYEANRNREFTQNDFKTIMKQHLKLYPDDVRVQLINRAKRMDRALEEMYANMERLKRTVEESKGTTQDWLDRFERTWQEIVESDIFKRIFSHFLLGEKNHAERHWAEMFETSDLAMKKERLLFCVKPLILGITNILPLLQGHLNTMLSKLEAEQNSQVGAGMSE